tara:strand:+ start:9747 stop:12650 length:2904 start_codon:yes stop_codon:yes gene_type:complete
MPNISKHSFNTIIPNVFVRSAVLNPAKNRTFTVDINFMLKVLNGASTDHLRNRLQMAVCLITDLDLLNTMLKYPKYMRNNIRSPQGNDKMMKQYISFESWCPCACDDTNNNREIINTKDGSYVNNYGYSVDFPLTDKAYDYLGCLIVPYYADPQNESITGLNAGDSEFTMGDYCIEDLLIGDKATAVRLAYKLGSSMPNYGSEEQYWVGSTHTGPKDNPMAGSSHHHGAHPGLVPKRLANKKVIDRRVEMQLAKNDLSELSDRLETIIGKTTSNLEVLRSIKSRNYFSDLLFSHQRDNSLRLFFNVDMGKLAQNSLKFPFLYNTAADLSSALTIRNMSLSRKRVRRAALNNSLTGIPEAPGVFSTREENLVCSLVDNTLQMFTATNDISKQSFVGLDEEVATYNDGFYQYKAKIEFFDSSPKKFSDLITDFKNVLGDYDKFVFAATSSGGYNCNSYSLNEKRIKELYAREKESWKKIVNTYLSTLITLGGSEVAPSFNVSYWQKALLSLTDPRSATLDTLLLMQKLATALLGKLDSIRNATSVVGNSEAVSYRSTISNVSPEAAFIKVERTFMSAYEAKNSINIGLDYMPDIVRSHTLPRYDLNSWKKRVNYERLRYASQGPTTANVNGYLSPRVIVLSGDSNVRVTSGMSFGTDAVKVLLSYFDPTGRATGTNASTSTDHLNNKRSLLGLSGISFQSFPQGTKGFVSSNRSCQSLIAAEEVLGKASRFILEPEDEKDKAKLKGVNDPEEEVAKAAFVDRFINGMSTDFDTSQPINVSQISDSLAAQTIKKSMGKNSFDFELNANATQTIEYLSGFNNGQVADPIWNKVTEDNISDLSSGGFLVCRLNSNGSITGKTNIYIQHLPTYNDVFIIGDEPSQKGGFGTSGFGTAAMTIPADPLNNQGYTDLPVEYWKSRTAFGTSGFGTDSGQAPFASGHDQSQGGFTTTAMTRRFNTGGNRGGGGSSGY